MRKFLIAVLTSLLLMAYTPAENREFPLPTKVENKQQHKQPSDSKAFRAAVKRQIEALGIQHSDLVYYQFREESGNGGSDLSVRHYNLFGMRYPTKRKTLAIGKTRSGYAIYRSWIDSVKDYKIFQDLYYKNLSRKEYLRKLRSSYSTKSDYLKNYL